MKTNFDDRTKSYFEAVKKNMGLFGENSGEELSLKIILKKKGIKDIFPEVLWKESIGVIGTCVLLKYDVNGKERYCAEVWVPYGGDGLYTHTYLFNKIPSLNDIKTAHLMSTINVQMDLQNISPIETCNECGHSFHWLDGKGSLQDKFDNLRERYCGC